MEAETILGTLMRRVAAIELAGEPQRRRCNSIRALLHLPLLIRPATPI